MVYEYGKCGTEILQLISTGCRRKINGLAQASESVGELGHMNI